MFTNNHNISLYLSLWLSDDNYDVRYQPDLVTVTEMLRPIKSIVLGRQLLKTQAEEKSREDRVIDLADLLPSRVGTAVHDAVEQSWTRYDVLGIQEKLQQLGYPASLTDRLVVNPANEPPPGAFVMWLEQRTEKAFNGYRVSGKFDAVIDGVVTDLKTTKTYTYIKGSNDTKYALQGSLYRWLNPDKITADVMQIQYIFTDWNPIKAKSEAGYPRAMAVTKELPLLTTAQCEAYLTEKLDKLKRYQDADQQDMPVCKPVEIWQDPPRYAYYSNPQKMTRATKVYDNKTDAQQRRDLDGGIVITRNSEPTYCRYCPANTVCLQAQQYVQEGILKI